MNRWKNYGLWVSLAAFVLLILQLCGVKIDAGQYNTLVNTILGVLVSAGLLNNPNTQNTWFGDDKKEDDVQ